MQGLGCVCNGPRDTIAVSHLKEVHSPAFYNCTYAAKVEVAHSHSRPRTSNNDRPGPFYFRPFYLRARTVNPALTPILIPTSESLRHSKTENSPSQTPKPPQLSGAQHPSKEVFTTPAPSHRWPPNLQASEMTGGKLPVQGLLRFEVWVSDLE